jgi:hypothetical protein
MPGNSVDLPHKQRVRAQRIEQGIVDYSVNRWNVEAAS